MVGTLLEDVDPVSTALKAAVTGQLGAALALGLKLLSGRPRSFPYGLTRRIRVKLARLQVELRRDCPRMTYGELKLVCGLGCRGLVSLVRQASFMPTWLPALDLVNWFRHRVCYLSGLRSRKSDIKNQQMTSRSTAYLRGS
jgi:hypothetical protein